MPGYTQSATSLLHENQQKFAFNRESGLAGRSSVAFQLERVPRSYYPWGVSFHVQFTDVNGNPADPGAFEIDIQTSDVDQDTQYCNITQWSGAASLNTNFVGRVEITNFFAKYVRAFVKTLTNAVYVTLTVTH